MHQFQTDVARLEPYEGGAVLMVQLACPEPSMSDQILGELHQCICHSAIRARADSDSDWAGRTQSIKPMYAFIDSEELERTLRAIKRRLRDRMVAARMAIPYLQKVATGKVPKLPPGIKRLSLNQMSEMVLDDLGMDEAGNVETRVWRQSIPVIHLATAVAVVMDQFETSHEIQISIGDFLTKPGLVRDVLNLAEQYAELIYKIKRPRIPADKLIHIRAVG